MPPIDIASSRPHASGPPRVHPWIHPGTVKSALVFATLFAFVFFIAVLALPPQRVGDGSEYYALFYAIKDGYRTFMTEPAYQAYDVLFKSGNIPGLADTNGVRHAFPPLIQLSGADFNHFWFYPAAAAITGGWLALFGMNSHASFLFLHTLLLGTLVYVSARAYGRVGVLAVAIVLVGSPIVWFVDKVHTEFFTFCSIAIATTLFARRKYFPAAVFLALASTQNISIGATAMLVLAIAAWRARNQPIRLTDVILAVATLVLVALHPLYYLVRVGVIDPQLLAGGAKIGLNFSNMLIWLIDPDVGLFPNWPIGLVIIALAAGSMRGSAKPSRLTIAYVAVFLITNLYAQASTQNLNSGATVHIARYATWYIGLFVPLLAFALTRMGSARRIVRWIGVAFLAASAVANASYFRPSKPETYMQPTAFSRQLQRRFPSFYDPPPQIFSERFTGIPIGSQPESFASLGPDCAKLVVVAKDGHDVVPTRSRRCQFDLGAMPDRVIHPAHWDGTIPDGRKYVYLHLTPQEQIDARPMLRPGVHYTPVSGNLRSVDFMGKGWYPAEEQGVWSQAASARIGGETPECPAHGFRFTLEFVPFITPANPQIAIRATANGTELGQHVFDKGMPSTATFDVPCTAVANGRLDLTFGIDGYISPLKAGVSGDGRELGVYLTAFWIDTAP
ncbi:hypothetical protein Y886_06500 [Xanthomonas hyacinthi DSM 19077]|nr:hypothetical protein Y886_06500 [Xanthomonas hyacinthi DSM 19077]